MRLKLADNRYLICNQYSGAVHVVNSGWWDTLGLDRLFFHGNSKPTSTIVDVDNFKKSAIREKLATRQELEQLDLFGYLLTEDRRISYEKRLEDFSIAKKAKRPHMIYFTPTVECPLSCIYCFENHSRGGSIKRHLSYTDLGAIDHFIESYRQENDLPAGNISLTLFGGESLMPSLKQFNEGIFALARRRGYFLDVVTSGVFFDDFYRGLFFRYQDILREVDITLDGPQGTHDQLRHWRNGGSTYGIIKGNIDKMLKMGVRVMVKTNFGKATINSIESLLDAMIGYGWFAHPCFLYTTNILRGFGGTDTNGQEVSEAQSVLKIVEVFKKEPYGRLLPKIRIESLKITDYMSNALGLLEIRTDPTKVINKFDGYPKYAFCHPDDGTMVNISYNGNVYTCNWAAGKDSLCVDNIFNEPDKRRWAWKSNEIVSKKKYCKLCDLSTFCGGGCPIDKQEKGTNEYHLECRKSHYRTLQEYIRRVLERKWIEVNQSSRNLITLRKGFNFNYQYESRISRHGTIKDDNEHRSVS